MLGIFLDTETNGLNPRLHHILEIAYKIVDMGSGSLVDQYENIVLLPPELFAKSDPESLKINKFTLEEIQEKGVPPERIAQEIIERFMRLKIKRKEAVFICQNPSFDRLFFSQLIDPSLQEKLAWPYHWLDLASMFWALSIERAKRKEGPLPWEIGLSKDMIASYYKIPPENKPHRAMNGASHLLLCYEAMNGFGIEKS